QDSSGYHSSWVQHPEMGTDISQIALGFGKIYKLNNHTCHTANSSAIKVYNSTAHTWGDVVTTESCSVQISVGDQDAALGSLTYSGHIYMLDPGATAWVQLTNSSPSTVYQSVAVAGKNVVFVNDAAGNIYERNPGTNTLVSSGDPVTPEVNGVLV